MHACSVASAVSNSVQPYELWSPGPLSMGFSRQEYWSGLPYPPPRDLPSPGIEAKSPASPALQVDSSPTEPPGKLDICGTYKLSPIHNLL